MLSDSILDQIQFLSGNLSIAFRIPSVHRGMEKTSSWYILDYETGRLPHFLSTISSFLSRGIMMMMMSFCMVTLWQCRLPKRKARGFSCSIDWTKLVTGRRTTVSAMRDRLWWANRWHGSSDGRELMWPHLTKAESYIVQQYVNNPYLIGGTNSECILCFHGFLLQYGPFFLVIHWDRQEIWSPSLLLGDFL